MAGFSVGNGIDRLSEDFSKLAEMSTDERYSIVDAAAEIVKSKFQKTISTMFSGGDGTLAKSIQSLHKGSDGEIATYVAPQGVHHTYNNRSSGKKRKAKRRALASEVGWILNYGAPGRNIPAHHWVDKALDGADSEVDNAMQDAFNEIVDSKTN